MKPFARSFLTFVIGALVGYLVGTALEWFVTGVFNIVTPVVFLFTSLFALLALSYIGGWRSALTEGLTWQIEGTFVGAFLVTFLRWILPILFPEKFGEMALFDKFFFTEPAWVLGG